MYVTDSAIKVDDGTFSWDPEIGPCLKEWVMYFYTCSVGSNFIEFIPSEAKDVRIISGTGQIPGWPITCLKFVMYAHRQCPIKP